MRQVFIAQINNLQNFSQIQKEACIDLLLLVMYADGVIDPNEADMIDRLLLDSTWSGKDGIEDYLSDIKGTIIETLKDTHAVEKFVEQAKLRIGDAQKIHDIYTLCAKMASADQNIDPKELEILKLLMDSLA